MNRFLLCLGLLLASAPACRAEELALDPRLQAALASFLDALPEASAKLRHSKAEPPLHGGLPGTISPDLPEAQGFVEAKGFPGADLPIGFVYSLGRPGLAVRDVFEDEEWVRLPEGAVIRRDFSRGFEVWRYPAGMTIAHRIYLKTVPRRLFELRLMRKLADEAGGQDGAWAFGLYRPVDGSPALAVFSLGHNEPSPRFTFPVDLPGGPTAVDMERVHPYSCRHCHASHGHGSYQFRDLEHVGPCGFVPDNPGILAEWAPPYQKKHGYFPFDRP